MRKATLLLLPALLLLTSCDQKALNFAKSARLMLNDYSAQLDAQIKAESAYYSRAAVLQVSHDHENLSNGLQADRNEHLFELAADLEENRKFALLYRNYLREYAQSEYNRRRDIYTGEVDATRPYLAKLQALQADKDRIDALGKLLDALTQKVSFRDEIGLIQQTVTDTKTDFDKLVCDGIAAKLTKATGKDKDALTQLQTDQKCPKPAAGGSK